MNITSQKKESLTEQRHRVNLKPQYDFIVCGSGSSGSVVARRLAENPDVSVLLLEAGGSDEMPSVTETARWVENLGTERDWKFVGQPNPHLKGRSMPLSMGKVLGGGSSINGLGWARGHKNDWDFFASECGHTAWNYESVLKIYRRIEDWQGAPDPTRRAVPFQRSDTANVMRSEAKATRMPPDFTDSRCAYRALPLNVVNSLLPAYSGRCEFAVSCEPRWLFVQCEEIPWLGHRVVISQAAS